MLNFRENVVRINVRVGRKNPNYDSCVSYAKSFLGAAEVMEAVEWEFNKAGESAEFEKMRARGWNFFVVEVTPFEVELAVEYVTKTKYYD